MNEKERDALLLEIARKELGLKTFESRNMDALDFKEQACWSIHAALIAAFDAGVRAARTEGTS